MASIIRIKRSETAGNPSTLGAGELAYSALTDNGSNGGDRLYIGIGTETSGDAANHYVIGGKFFTDRLDHTAGTLTASSAIVVDGDKKIDDLLVDNIQINGNTVSTTNSNGNLTLSPNGTGLVDIAGAYTLPRADGSNGQALITDGSGAVSFTTISTELDISGDSGTDTVSLVNDTLAIDGTSAQGISTAVTNNTVTITAANASTSAKGVAQFSSDNFAASSGTITIKDGGVANAELANSQITVAGDTGSQAIDLGDTLTVTGGAAITSSVSGDAVTLAVAVDDSSIEVSSDALRVKAAGITNAMLAGSIANAKLVNDGITIGSDDTSLGDTITDLNGLTSVDVDNITIDGNEISSTNSNGNISLNPNGTGTVDFNSSRLTGLADPTNAQDAATKAYVDARAAGLDPKESVRVASTADVDITSELTNGDTLDGVTLATNDRVLLRAQSDDTENGVYVVVASGGASRATDFDQPAEVTSGVFFFVEEGNTYADAGFVLTSDGGQQTVGTDSLTFVQFSGAGQIVAGNGLAKSGNTLSVNVANGIEISGDNVQLESAVAGDGLTYNSGVLDVVGTADKITVSSNAITIASTYVGQNTITTLGTITTGTWNGTAIAAANGGTGQTSYSTGDILVASGSSALGKLTLGVSGKVLQSNGSTLVYDDVDGGTYS